MTPNDKLIQLERALESTLIEAMKATDGAGLKVNILPAAALSASADHWNMGSGIPTTAQLRSRIIEMIDAKGNYLGYRAEESAARNIALLAKVWESAVRYWDFRRELSK